MKGRMPLYELLVEGLTRKNTMGDGLHLFARDPEGIWFFDADESGVSIIVAESDEARQQENYKHSMVVDARSRIVGNLEHEGGNVPVYSGNPETKEVIDAFVDQVLRIIRSHPYMHHQDELTQNDEAW
ncbi:hypothetical protein CMO91_05910 [Candidatus Woesearchaeota archaeon]|nr:hypothetical protein [Candidatus Woesearchaeota archaeon]